MEPRFVVLLLWVVQPSILKSNIYALIAYHSLYMQLDCDGKMMWFQTCSVSAVPNVLPWQILVSCESRAVWTLVSATCSFTYPESVWIWLIELGFNDPSTLVCHFVSSPREREKIDRRDSRRDEREGQGRKRNRNESEETEEIKTSPPYPYLLQG